MGQVISWILSISYHKTLSIYCRLLPDQSFCDHRHRGSHPVVYFVLGLFRRVPLKYLKFRIHHYYSSILKPTIIIFSLSVDAILYFYHVWLHFEVIIFRTSQFWPHVDVDKSYPSPSLPCCRTCQLVPPPFATFRWSYFVYPHFAHVWMWISLLTHLSAWPLPHVPSSAAVVRHQ